MPEKKIVEAQPWKDVHTKKILHILGQKSGPLQTQPGVYFTDCEFPVEYIINLTAHPKIDNFEAEYGLYITKENNEYNPERSLKFLLTQN